MALNANMDDQDTGAINHHRDRHLTEKGLEYQIQLRMDDFKTAVSRWRRESTQTRVALDEANDVDILRENRRRLSEEAGKTKEAFDRLCTLTDSDVVHDAKLRYEEVEMEHCTLIKDVSEAIRELQLDRGSFVSSRSSRRTPSRKSSSCKSTISSIRAEAAVEVAATETELKYLEEELRRKMELEKLQLSKKLDIARAKLTAMTQVDEGDSVRSQIPVQPMKRENVVIRYLDTLENGTFPDVRRKLDLDEEFTPRDLDNENGNPRLNVHAKDFVPQEYPSHSTVHSQPVAREEPISVLAKTLETLTASRINCPDPPTFTGNPLEFISWKTSFTALIENKKVPEEERIHFLKKYLGGAAKEAVEGLFLLDTAAAYREAKLILEERFGHPFLVTESFRDKLEAWPKVKLPSELRRLSDFLKQCQVAMTCVPGLEILNDCRENRKLLRKLPDWVVRKWSKVVIQTVGRYPSFAEFSKFVKSESDMANHPITTMYEEKKPFRSHKEKARCLSTDIKEEPKQRDKTNVGGVKDHTPKPCILCSSTEHPLGKCPCFLKKSLEERKKFVREKRLCFGCLKQGHKSSECQRKHRCGTCSRRHPTALHEDLPQTGIDQKPEREFHEKQSVLKVKEPEEAKVMSHKVHLGDNTSSSMVVPVWVSSEQQSEVLTYALLDTQSDASFILDDLAETLQANRKKVSLKVTTMTSASSTVEASLISDLQIRGMNHGTIVKLHRCYTSNSIPVDRSHIPSRKVAESWPHLQGMAHQIPALQNCEVGLLIGYNCPQALAPREVVTGEEDQPYAVRTDLGWSVVGGSEANERVRFCHRTYTKENPEISPRDVLAVLQTDFADAKGGETLMSQEDLKFIQLLEEGITREAGHLMMPLPFRDGPPLLPDNRQSAEVRLKHLKKKLQKDQVYKERYVQFIEDVLEKGEAEEVVNEGVPGRAWYIPHHGVYHPKKPQKLRVVFDCSARYQGDSLNTHLLTGPDLLNTLTGVLWRFRQHPVAVQADIERMFHQFLVCGEHRDYLRFLWWEKGNLDAAPKDFRMKVHLFGATSSPGCANFALKYLAAQRAKDFPQAAEFIQKNFYMDDGLQSCKDEDEAITLVKESQELCLSAKIRLHKFVSNSQKVMESINPVDRGSSPNDVELGGAPTGSVLGIRWQVSSDTLTFASRSIDNAPTRRGILSAVAQVFDPLGFLAPVVLEGKILLQELCKDGVDWDDELPDHLKPAWTDWKTNCKDLDKVHIERCFQPKDFKVERTEIHHFADASTRGYGQCSYVRFVGKEQVHCSLIGGKARVAPLKTVTVPRLELTAALVSALMSERVRAELDIPIDKEYYWTDSQVVLSYINNQSRRFHVFVANRVERIRQLSTPDQWFHVATADNPADLASRGTSVSGLLESCWFQGPSFLWDRSWKPPVKQSFGLEVGDPEVRRIVTLESCVAVGHRSIQERLSVFSDWTKTLSAIARLKRAAKRGHGGSRPATCLERLEAEKFIIREVQQVIFDEELQDLKRDGGCVKTTSALRSLSPFIDEDGILRGGGRLRSSKLPDKTIHPIILPKEGHVTTIIVGYLACNSAVFCLISLVFYLLGSRFVSIVMFLF